jgi:hypothetical protein
LSTTLLVFILFQAPVLRWLSNSWRRGPSAGAPRHAADAGSGGIELQPALAAAS